MDRSTALSLMIAPGTRRVNKSYRQGVMQIFVTRACDQACFCCTQNSQLAGKPSFMTPKQFEDAVLSLQTYFGVYGCFGGNPALSPYFDDYCAILRKHVPFEQRGLWCNHPRGKGKVMRETFCPGVSNLNVHLSQEAYNEFKRDWPESNPVGLHQDSRHSPCFVAMKDVIADESKRWELISSCDINRNWSAMMCVVKGQVKGFFCEIAGAISMLHENDPDWPDVGLPLYGSVSGEPWWKGPMEKYGEQVDVSCHSCGVPLRGHGENAMSEDGKEQVSQTHAANYEPKRKGRPVELVTELVQLGVPLVSTTAYLQNSNK
jgi:hypothetical protein